MDIIISVVIAYLLGSISFSYVLAKKLKKIDIREHGSGNAGATNTLRVLGAGPAVLVLALDMFKGVVAVLIAIFLQEQLVGTLTIDGLAPALAGLAAIFGHNWPIYYRFKGGKGVATTIGVIASTIFFPAIYVGIIAILLVITTRYVSLGSLFFAVVTPFVLAFTIDVYGHPYPYLYLTIIIGMMTVWRHRTNIVRLLNGTENKIRHKEKT